MKVSQNVKDWTVIGAGVAVLALIAAWAMWAVVCQYRATQECAGTNGVVVRQASIFEPVACVVVPR